MEAADLLLLLLLLIYFMQGIYTYMSEKIMSLKNTALQPFCS
jgi:hypothetical protein